MSNSYGGADQGPLPSYDHPGVAITASSGDSGYGVLSPASSPSVVAVGGTTLRRASNARGWSETAWSGAGSGCSSRTAKPSWQTAATGCPRKAVSDVSAVADPATGVAVYDSYAFNGARAGRCSAAPASPRRSSPPSTRWPGAGPPARRPGPGPTGARSTT